MKENQVREHIQKGWIRALVTFEVVGKPKEHVESALEGYLENIKKDSRIMYLKEDRENAIEHSDGMWSTFCEAEVLVKNLETFTWLCINFSPASIEILEPDEMAIEAREVTNWLNDLLSKVHEIGTSYRSHKAANEHLTIAMNQLIKNAILLSLKTGTKTDNDLEHDTGILAEQLQPFLKHLVEKGQIEDLNHAYALPDPARKILPKEQEGKKGNEKMSAEEISKERRKTARQETVRQTKSRQKKRTGKKKTGYLKTGSNSTKPSLTEKIAKIWRR